MLVYWSNCNFPCICKCIKLQNTGKIHVQSNSMMDLTLSGRITRAFYQPGFFCCIRVELYHWTKMIAGSVIVILTRNMAWMRISTITWTVGHEKETRDYLQLTRWVGLSYLLLPVTWVGFTRGIDMGVFTLWLQN